MSQFVETATRTFTTSGVVGGKFLRCKQDSAGKVLLAGAGEASLGTSEIPAFTSGDQVTLRLWSAPGTRKVVAAGVIAINAAVYGAANGQVSATVSGSILGYVVDRAAAVAGDVIEICEVR